MPQVGVDEPGAVGGLADDAKVLCDRPVEHAKQQHVARLHRTVGARTQPPPRRGKQVFAAECLGPVGGIGGNRLRLSAHHFAPDTANQAQAIGAPPLQDC